VGRYSAQQADRHRTVGSVVYCVFLAVTADELTCAQPFGVIYRYLYLMSLRLYLMFALIPRNLRSLDYKKNNMSTDREKARGNK
jgi:hypothetical protein